jgi:hypothetical protein
VNIFFGQFFENDISGATYWATLFHEVCIYFDKKNGLGYTLGGFFSQTHLVTLSQVDIRTTLVSAKFGRQEPMLRSPFSAKTKLAFY